MLKTLLLVGAGGFLGSIGRYLGSLYGNRLIPSDGFPFGTFLVNILGCFLIGLIYGLAEKHDWVTPEARLFLATGFCGGFTTFSTFSHESFTLLNNGQHTHFVLYISLSVLIGIALAFAGLTLGKA